VGWSGRTSGFADFFGVSPIASALGIRVRRAPLGPIHTTRQIRFEGRSVCRRGCEAVSMPHSGRAACQRAVGHGSDKARIDLPNLSCWVGSIMEMMDGTTLQVLLVVFFATVIRSTFGFGEALIAVPLLALTIPIEIAAPVAVLLSITIAAVVIVQDWRKIHLSGMGWLLASTFPGIPLGIMLLASIHQQVVKGVLGIVIVAFAGYSFVGKKPPELHQDSRIWLLGCGFLAGVLGGAYGMNGPPLVIYGSMRRWSPQHFRATLQGYFLPASVVTMAGYWFAGLWVPAVSHYYLISLPVALPTIFLGRFVNQRMRGDSFLNYVHGGLVFVGVVLLIQAIRRT
jgi:uncharacterized protein